MTEEKLWQAVLAEIQLSVSSANFNTWFKNTNLVKIEKDRAVVATPNSFVKEWLESKYNQIILKSICKKKEEVKKIEYIIERPKRKEKEEEETPPENQLKFQEFSIDQKTNLNPKYTFDSFVVGPFNELSHAAAWAVAENPGLVYNPLFIYGGVGLGKTHLLQSIGNEIIKKSDKKVLYIQAQKFISGVVNGIRNGRIEEFKEEYKDIDVLIIDDIQFLSGKEKTQEELFHTFNSLYEKNKQIILSSDRPPKSIRALAERLRSRFEGGMIADIDYPDLETRIAILKTKAQEHNVSFPDEIYSYIAENIYKNIRELEGALNKLIAHQKLTKNRVDLKSAKHSLKSLLNSPTRNMSPSEIIKAVSRYYNVPEKELKGSSRKKEVVRPRQIVMYLLREELGHSFPFIGRQLGGKDHTSVMYSYSKIEKELKGNDQDLSEEITLIKQTLFTL